MKRIILASTSPRRKILLNKLGISFDIVSPDYEEPTADKEFSYSFTENIAKNKGKSVLNYAGLDSVVISADTVVVLGNKILGKPKNYENAFQMLSCLKGRKHKVVTSVCVIDSGSGKELIDSETSEVEFNELNDNDIKEYINRFRPYDKAGSYGIQELPDGFIKNIKGDFDNIVGLPTSLVKSMLEKFK